MAKLRLVGVITFGRHLAHWLATWNKMWKFQFVCSSSQARINSLVINPSNLDSNSPFFNCIFAHTTAAPPSESLQKLKLQRLAEYLPDLKFLTRKLRKVFAMNKKFHFLSDEEKRRTTKKWFPTVLLGSDSKLGSCGALAPPVFFICDIIYLWSYWMILFIYFTLLKQYLYLVQSFLAIEPKILNTQMIVVMPLYLCSWSNWK